MFFLSFVRYHLEKCAVGQRLPAGEIVGRLRSGGEITEAQITMVEHLYKLLCLFQLFIFVGNECGPALDFLLNPRRDEHTLKRNCASSHL